MSVLSKKVSSANPCTAHSVTKRYELSGSPCDPGTQPLMTRIAPEYAGFASYDFSNGIIVKQSDD